MITPIVRAVDQAESVIVAFAGKINVRLDVTPFDGMTSN